MAIVEGLKSTEILHHLYDAFTAFFFAKSTSLDGRLEQRLHGRLSLALGAFGTKVVITGGRLVSIHMLRNLNVATEREAFISAGEACDSSSAEQLADPTKNELTNRCPI